MLKTFFTRILNTGSTKSIYVNYQRSSDLMWQYQVQLKPNKSRNIWFIENTFETFLDNPTIQYIFYYEFPPEITSLPTPTNTNPIPTPTPTNTQLPTNTPTPSVTPTITPSFTSPEIILDAILTNNGNYIKVGENQYLKFIDP